MRHLDLTKPLYDSDGAVQRLVAESELQIVTVGTYGLFSIWDKSTGVCMNTDASYLLLTNGGDAEDQARWEGAAVSDGVLLIFESGSKVH